MAMLYHHRVVLEEGERAIKTGEAARLSFQTDFLKTEAGGCRFKLRLRGRSGIHPSWMYEGGLPYLYRDIDDALSQETHHSRFSLKITANGEDYPRRAYCKILCPPAITPQFDVPEIGDCDWILSCMVKTRSFSLLPGGQAEIRILRFLKKEGRDCRDIQGEADETVALSLLQDGEDWQTVRQNVRIDQNTAAVLVTIAVEKASGTIWIEDPQLKNSAGFNILPPADLTNAYEPTLNWLGENLSQKEWSRVQVALNGEKLEPAALFQRCHAGSENEIALPDGLVRNGENELEIWNVQDYFCAAPYMLSRIELLWEEKRPVRIISAPMTVRRREKFAVLLETLAPNLSVRISADDGIKAPGTVVFEKAGLHVVEMKAAETGCGMKITVSAAGQEDSAVVGRIVIRDEDGVVTGTGDAVYIPQEIPAMEEFLCWYMAGHLGNMITFRPVYRWSGSYTCNPETWKRLVELCNALFLKYCLLVDGRELPGINANPTREMMLGEHYLGSQGHERDGAFYYWRRGGAQGRELLFQEISGRVFRHPDFAYRVALEYTPEAVYPYYNPVAPRDMKEAAEQFVRQFGTAMKGIRRHTGPSVLFKYMFEAGLEVGGAELMYGPQEVILSALRGASFAYGRERFTAHLAVQWSTTPHDSEARYRRYRLALHVSYLQGCHHINTEEGTYRLEEYFAEMDRFSEPCQRHAQVQREFLHFVETHTRRGSFVSPVALLHGRYDGWVCFTRCNVWAQAGETWKFGAPEESWDLIKVFYPDSVLSAIYRHPCPDEPQGYYSRTPYGPVDILPAEAGPDKLGRYRFAAFLGFHAALAEDISKLCAFVREGGRLLLGGCHLFTGTRRQAVLSGESNMLDATALTGVRLGGFARRDGGPALFDIEMIGNHVEVLKEWEGKPLLLKHRMGKGCVYFVSAGDYPASAAVRNVYESVLHQFGRDAAAEQAGRGWMTAADTVETAVYDREDGHRCIYAINTNWWDEEMDAAYARLHLSDRTYSLPISRGVIHIVTIHGDIAVEAADMETEVIEIRPHEEGFALFVQGNGSAKLRIFCKTPVSSEDAFTEDTENGVLCSVRLEGPKVLRFCRKP